MLTGVGVSAPARASDGFRSALEAPRKLPVATASGAAQISWGNAEPVPGAAALEQNVAQSGGISQISCSSPGNCGAIGFYTTPGSGGDSLPFVDSQVNGTWGTAIEVPGLSALNAYLPRLSSLSCSSDGNCTAVGQTSTGTSSAAVLPLMVTEANGSWGNAEVLTGIASLTSSQEATLLSVSCWSAGDCAAGGTYWDDSGNEQALVVTQSGGTWTPQEMPGTGALNAGGNAAVTTVSCSASGACAAGGSYTAVNSSNLNVGSVFLATGTGGSWDNAEEVPGMAALGGAYPQPVIDTVSCAGSGDCAAGGTYVNSAGTQAFVISGSGGSWADAIEVPGTADLNASGGTAALDSVSCTSAGDCAAGGYYTDSSGQQDGFVVDESGGTWDSAEELPGDAALTGGGGSVGVTSVSCGAAGECVAGGQYEYEPEGYAFSGFLVDETDGTWGAAFAVPGLTSLNIGWSGSVVSVSCPSAGNCSAGGSYSGSPGQPFVVSSTASTPTCQDLTQADGQYEFGGCFTEEDNDSVDVTDQQSNLDGVDVSASASDDVTYDDGGTAGDNLVSAGDSTLSLDLDGTLTPIFSGTLDDSLTGPITVSVPGSAAAHREGASVPGAASASGATIAGLPLSGTLTLTPSSGGSATVTGSVTLPAVLGSGKAALTATTTVNQGLSNIKVTISKASFLQLFALTKLTLTYSAGTWNLTATASTGGTKATTLSGSLTYADDTLTSATMTVKNFSLAGLVDVSALTVSYAGGNWSGNATIGSGASATAASISLTYNSTGLSSALLSARNVSLFGVLRVSTFDLSYSSDDWKIAVTAPDGGGVSGSMTATGGIISAASLKVTKVSFLGVFTVSSAEMAYAAQAPNAACKSVKGDEVWCGGWRVLLPSASVVSGVSGTLAAASGEFASGSIDVKGSVPLLDGIILTELGAKVSVNPPPTTISGTAGMRFGPKIKGTSLLDFTGTLTRKLPGAETSGAYDFDGHLSALGKLKGDIKITVPGDGAATTIDLSATASVGKASASGTLQGTFTAEHFSLSGTVKLTVLGHKVSGKMAVDNKGMAACGKYGSSQAGFEFDWATDSVTFLSTHGCTEKGF
jgi:hypothetical protein